MDINAIQTAVFTELLSVWGDTTKVFGDNVTIPNDLAEYVRVTFLPADRRQAGMGGNNTTRQSGVVIAQVFVNNAKVQGTKRSNELASQLISALEYKAFSGDDWMIRLRAGDPRNTGQASGSSYYQTNVNFAYYSDTI
jgi:hypothetical protein